MRACNFFALLKACGCAVAFIVAGTSASAALLINEPFDYPNGNLVPNGGWANHSGTGSLVQVNGGSISLNQGSGSREDVNRTTGTTLAAGESIFAAFDLTVPSGATDVYFAHFMETNTLFNSRTYTAAPTSGGDYTVGVSDSNTLTAKWPTDLSFNTTYRVVIKFDFDSGDSTLWVNPSSEASASVVHNGGFNSPITAFGFRQAGGSFVQVIDNLNVATSFDEALTGIPEPATLSLFGIGLIGMLACRRRS